MSLIPAVTPNGDKISGKAYPIPARRTQKFRSKSSSTLHSLEECEKPQASAKPLDHVLKKRPLTEQISNPELSQRTKPPRPPPPVRQVPPRTYTQLDVQNSRGNDDKSINRLPVVIDTRGRRRLHSDAPQPKRPPLPYETFVHQSPQHQESRIDHSSNVPTESKELREATIVVTPPADYEVAVPPSAGSKSVESTRKLPLGGNEIGLFTALNASAKIALLV